MPRRKMLAAISAEDVNQLDKFFTHYSTFSKPILGINNQYVTEHTTYDDEGISGTNRSETPLGYACRLGKLKSAQKLLELRASTVIKSNSISIENDAETPLFIAAYYRRADIVAELLNRGDKFTKDEAKRLLAVFVTKPEGDNQLPHAHPLNKERSHIIFRTLLESYPNLINREFTHGKESGSLLYLACAHGRMFGASFLLVKELLARGADIHYKTRKEGRTPFFAAALAGDKQTVQYLLSTFGKDEINLQQTDREGYSIVYRLLHQSMRTPNDVAMAEYLFKQGYRYQKGDRGIQDYLPTYQSNRFFSGSGSDKSGYSSSTTSDEIKYSHSLSSSC